MSESETAALIVEAVRGLIANPNSATLTTELIECALGDFKDNLLTELRSEFAMKLAELRHVLDKKIDTHVKLTSVPLAVGALKPKMATGVVTAVTNATINTPTPTVTNKFNLPEFTINDIGIAEIKTGYAAKIGF
jgi:hypothetical protein